MKNVRALKVLVISPLIAFGIVSCDKPGPAETAGKKVDQTMEKAGDKMTSVSDKVGNTMSDTEITSKVKAAIFAEPGLDSLQISVDTKQGVVTLSGKADSKANSDKAKSVSKAVVGVVEVKNMLKIQAGL